MSEEYWKVEANDLGYYNVKSGDGHHIKCTPQGLVVEDELSGEATWTYKANAAAVAFHANHLDIRPPAPVVELPSAFGCDWKVNGDWVHRHRVDSAVTTQSKANTISWLRAMLSALDPEPVGPWVVESIGGDFFARNGVHEIRPSYNGYNEDKERFSKAIAREANRIEAERAGNER
jgi:hypothetical protein